MLVFSTKVPLKATVTRENCLELFIEWITESPHYHVESIAYDTGCTEDFDLKLGAVSFSIRHYETETVNITACRLINSEAEAEWINDCIFLSEGAQKTLLIQLHMNRLDFGQRRPKINKPHIIKKFVETGYCSFDAQLAVDDKVLVVDDTNLEMCASIMGSAYTNMMPVVYISRDSQNKYAISPDFLGRIFSGVAHVFREHSREQSFKLKELTGGKNAHSGFIGVYYPASQAHELFGLDYYGNYKLMGQDIINTVHQALVNRVDSTVYNWEQIVALQARQKMHDWKLTSEQARDNLDVYVSAFDAENKNLKDMNKSLLEQNTGLRTQLDLLRSAMATDKKEERYLLSGPEKELYPGEANDLLYSILSQIQDKYEPNSRAYVLIKSMAQANPPIGACSNTMEALKSTLSGGGKMNASALTALKDIGFTVQSESRHYKLLFHNDPRYMFTVAKSPGDHREGKNLFSDIKKQLDVEKKVL